MISAVFPTVLYELIHAKHQRWARDLCEESHGDGANFCVFIAAQKRMGKVNDTL